MALVVPRQRRRWGRVAATPGLDLRLTPALDRLPLVLALQVAVVAFVEPPVATHRHPRPPDLFEGELQRADGPFLQRRVGYLDVDAFLGQQPAGIARLGLAELGEVDVVPPGEQVGLVPLAFAVAEQDENTHAARV